LNTGGVVVVEVVCTALSTVPAVPPVDAVPAVPVWFKPRIELCSASSSTSST
jgi:hypothetical protein